MKLILNDTLPFKPWMSDRTRNLPGIQPVPKGEWLIRNEVFSEQMVYREHLLNVRRNDVFSADEASLPAQKELLALVMSELDSGYKQSGSTVRRPDGVRVDTADDMPMVSIAKLVQEDFFVLEKQDGESTVTAAVMCFPASWTLSEKMGKGLIAVHGIVPSYDPDIAKRVQRMFDAIRPEQPLWRSNFVINQDPDLYQPKLESEQKNEPGVLGRYLRVERQTLRRLPVTDSVVFGIHSYTLDINTLPKDEYDLLLLHSERG